MKHKFHNNKVLLNKFKLKLVFWVLLYNNFKYREFIKIDKYKILFDNEILLIKIRKVKQRVSKSDFKKNKNFKRNKKLKNILKLQNN